MLTEVRYIQNIGRFEKASPTANAGFGHCTLVFGENGWGKSTLADILRSLATGNSAIVLGRKTLAGGPEQKAVLRLGKQQAVLESQNIIVASSASFNMQDDIYMARLHPASILAAAIQVDQPEVDAIFIACTAIRAVEIAEEAEKKLGKPVVTANQALFWQSIRSAGFQAPIPGFGRLLRM